MSVCGLPSDTKDILLSIKLMIYIKCKQTRNTTTFQPQINVNFSCFVLYLLLKGATRRLNRRISA